MTAAHHPKHDHAAPPPWRDARVLRQLGQLVVVLLVVIAGAYLISNLATAMSERGLSFGFSFLDRRAGFEIGESPVPYSADDSYGRAFLVGLMNTLFVSLIGIVLATVLGILVGIARLSPNWLLSRAAAAYVEVIRNTPLLVQLFLIYFAVLLQLPAVREAIVLPGPAYLNQRGLFLPGPQVGPTFGAWLVILGAALAVAFVVRRAAAHYRAAGRTLPAPSVLGVAAFIGLAAAGWLALGEAPVTFDLPVLGRFNVSGGLALSTSFVALLTGLVIYTAAFIAEIVRGGIQAVRRGQLEAARALGLSEGDTLRLVVFPQALRVIVPPLTSQYLNLTKNSSLAIAVGYPDLFKVGTTIANQTGQPVPVLVLVMATYLVISLGTSALMNLYNRRIQVLER
jgi:general L-amino acid transport system permease protein